MTITTVLIAVWVLVTLVTDSQAALYRKATQYRRQVEHQRNEQRHKELRDGSLISYNYESSKVQSERGGFYYDDNASFGHGKELERGSS